MVDNIPGNFQNKFNAIKSMCNFCKVTITQYHVMTCKGRLEMRKDLDLSNLDDLVEYFNRYLEDINTKKIHVKD